MLACKQCIHTRSHSHPGGDGRWAMELWWRSVALQTLRTYLTSLVATGRVPNPSAQVCCLNEAAGV